MKVYINNTYCPDAVAMDLFDCILNDPNIYFSRISKILCWNHVLYDLVLANPYTKEFYFRICDE